MKYQPLPMTPPRDYNDLEDRGDFFVKSSAFTKKIEAEALFYEEIPTELKKFYPQFLGRVTDGRWPKGYALEKIIASDASLYEVGKLTPDADYFPTLFRVLKEYLTLVPKKNLLPDAWNTLLQKTLILRDQDRLTALKETSVFTDVEAIFSRAGLGSVEAFRSVLHQAITEEFTRNPCLTVWASHGDLCLSNILVCSGKLYLVDPRGKNHGEDGYLIPHYDLAKLSQCLVGAYDHINHSMSSHPAPQRHLQTMKKFCDELGIRLRAVRLVESSHFLAMLPLHLSHPAHVRAFAEQAIVAYRDALTL